MRVVRLIVLFGVAVTVLSSASQSLDGIWQSQGYGYALSVQGSLLTEFETSSATCVAGFTAERKNIIHGKWDAAFKSKQEGVFFIKAGEDSDHAVLHREDSVPDIQIERIANLPPICDHPTSNTAMGNFEVFAHTWAENYVSFELRHADWNKIVAEYRPKMVPQTTPTQLFEILESMIQSLGDIHTYIAAGTLKRSTPMFWRPGTSLFVTGNTGDFAKHGRWKLFAITNRGYLQKPPKMFCNRHLQYGHVNASIGYLRILSFGGYSRHNDLAALASAMDTIFADPGLKGLVIDMRLSFGGSDELGLAIARRLSSQEYLAYTVRARSNPLKRDQWTPGDAIMVRPSSKPSFRGPVVELTSSITMSAAETFTEALMGRTPRVIRVGESTQGVFCDILDRHLPNGWTFGLPNAVYRTADRRAFDAVGIPPDIDIPEFTEAEIAGGKDPAMAKAVEILENARR